MTPEQQILTNNTAANANLASSGPNGQLNGQLYDGSYNFGGINNYLTKVRGRYDSDEEPDEHYEELILNITYPNTGRRSILKRPSSVGSTGEISTADGESK